MYNPGVMVQHWMETPKISFLHYLCSHTAHSSPRHLRLFCISSTCERCRPFLDCESYTTTGQAVRMRPKRDQIDASIDGLWNVKSRVRHFSSYAHPVSVTVTVPSPIKPPPLNFFPMHDHYPIPPTIQINSPYGSYT
jgi:hypothetical protein